MAVIKRCEQQIENTWKLEDLYESKAEWEKDGIKIDELIEELKHYNKTLKNGADVLFACLSLYEKANQLLEKYYVYANMTYHQDTADSSYQAMAGAAEIKMNAMSQAASFLTPQILELSDDMLEDYYQKESGLEGYRKFIEDIQRQKEHTLDERGEEMLAAANEVAKGAANIFSMFNNADIRFDDIAGEDGEKTTLTQGNYISFMESQNRDLRKAAFFSMYKTYKQHINTIAAIYDNKVRGCAFFAKQRGYESALAASLDDTQVPVSVYHKLIEAVHANLQPMYDYVSLRKKVLDVEELHMYDVYVPMVKDVDKTYSFEEAKQLVLEGLAPLGEEYLGLLQEGFDNRWIDVYENTGKRTGAYSWGAYGAHPYVLMNYQGTLNHVFTLAHEMGHALHSHYSDKNQPYLYAGYRIFVAEVASTCNEALLIHYLLQKTEDKNERAYLINYFLDQFKGTLYRQTMFAEFELKAHEAVQNKQTLTADYLCDIYKKLNELYFGPDIVTDPEIAYEWAKIPHFYTPFYVYQYATGFSAAIAISNRILKEGATAVEDYKKFLSGGGSMDPISLLKLCNVDMTSSEPVESALNVFKEYVDLLDKEIC